MFKSGCFASVIFLMIVFGLIRPAIAADSIEQLNARLTVVEHQKMRAYRMTKSACLVMMGADAQVHAETAYITAYEFDVAMQDLLQDTDASLQTRLQDAQAFSKALTSSAMQVASGDFHAVPVGLLISHNGPVADMMDSIRVDISSGIRVSAQQQELQRTVHWVHAQNALIQELLRDLCFISLDISGAQAKAALLEKLELFEKRALLLKEGSVADGILKAPNVNIKIQLTKVLTAWTKVKPYFEKAAAGDLVDLSDIQLAYIYGEGMSGTLDKVLVRYEGL